MESVLSENERFERLFKSFELMRLEHEREDEKRRKEHKKWRKAMEVSKKKAEKFNEEWRIKHLELNKAIEKNQALIGSLSNSFGRWGEAQFQCRLWEKLNTLGYNFGTGSNGPRIFKHDGKPIAECDDFIENGELVCVAEIKNHVTKFKIDDHIERIEIIRGWMDRHHDKRKIIGAMAGVVWERKDTFDAKEYAFLKGLYVMTQSNENVEALMPPKDFVVRKW